MAIRQAWKIHAIFHAGAFKDAIEINDSVEHAPLLNNAYHKLVALAQMVDIDQLEKSATRRTGLFERLLVPIDGVHYRDFFAKQFVIIVRHSSTRHC